jgi:hypothetical protein
MGIEEELEVPVCDKCGLWICESCGKHVERAEPQDYFVPPECMSALECDCEKENPV